MVCTCLLCPWKPSRDGWYFPGSNPPVASRLSEWRSQALSTGLAATTAPRCLPARTQNSKPDARTGGRQRVQISVPSSVCGRVNSAGKGVLLGRLQESVVVAAFLTAGRILPHTEPKYSCSGRSPSAPRPLAAAAQRSPFPGRRRAP